MPRFKHARSATTAVALAALFSFSHAEIIIGVAGPMTGQYAAGGEQMRVGVEAAVAEINARGGLLGEKVRVEVGDDVCDPRQAVAVANSFVNKKVSFVVGHYCSGSTIPASEVYAEAQIPMITISTNGKVTDRGLKNVFRITGRDDQESAVATKYLLEKHRNQKMAVVDDKTAYGKGQADIVARLLKESGQQPAMHESITAGEKDYTALVSKLKANKIEVLFYGGYHSELGLILRQAAQAGVKLQVVSGNTSINTELLTAAGPALEGLVFTFFPDPRLRPAGAAVVKQFRDKGTDPDGYILFCYAAVQAFAQAAETAKSTKFPAMQPVLAKGTFDTVLGKVAFDAKGDPREPGYTLYQWKGKEYVMMK